MTRVPTTATVTTASVLVRGSVEGVREAVVRLGREAWVAPVGDGWVLVLPDPPAVMADDVDPYDLITLARAVIGPGCPQALVFCVRGGRGVCQLMSRDHDTAFIGWRSAASGEPAASRVEPDGYSFAKRFGVPERAELLELLLDDHTGTPEDRLAAFCLALGLPVVAIGATAGHVAEERLHLPGIERHCRRGRLERWLGRDFSPRPWVRRTWVIRLLQLGLLVAAVPVLLRGWLVHGSRASLLLAAGAAVALVGAVAEITGEASRRSVRRGLGRRRSTSLRM